VLLACVLPQPARAQDADARTYFDAGRQAYEAGDYRTAIRSLELAYKAAPKAPIAFSLAQAYRKQFIVDGDGAKLKAAVTLYRKYLDDVPQGGRREDAVTYLGELQPQLLRMEAVNPVAAAPATAAATQLMVMSRVKEARASIDGSPPVPVPATRDVTPGPHRIRVVADGYFPEDVEGLAVQDHLVVVEGSLREMPAQLVLRDAAGSDVALDGRSISAGSAPLAVPAGRHFLTVQRRGHRPLARNLDLARGATVTVDADLPATTQRRVSYVVLGVAAAALAGAGTTTFLALRAQSDAQAILDKRSTTNLTPAELADYDDARSRRGDLVTASTVLYGVAAAAGVTGLLLFLLDEPRAEAAPAGVVAPQVGPDEIGASWTVRF
jgi:PEGA domain-containing protein